MNLVGRTTLSAVILTTAAVLPAQPTTRPLGPGESYTWSIRASHADELLLAVGDSLDVVLLRDRCGGDAGHGQKGCWDASNIRVTPRWAIAASRLARIRPLREGSWIFGRGVAGARIRALRPGATLLSAILPGGQIAADSIRVISAPGVLRIVLEPKPATILAGDTVRFRVTARDSADRIVATLPLPGGWNVVGPADSMGYAPVAFYPWERGGTLVVRLGHRTDSLELRFVPRSKP